MEVRWTITTRPSRRQEVAAGKRAGSRSPQGGWRMGAVTTKSAKTRGGNYDGQCCLTKACGGAITTTMTARRRWWRWTTTTRRRPPLLLLLLLTLLLLSGSTRPVPPRCRRWGGGMEGKSKRKRGDVNKGKQGRKEEESRFMKVCFGEVFKWSVINLVILDKYLVRFG